MKRYFTLTAVLSSLPWFSGTAAALTDAEIDEIADQVVPPSEVYRAAPTQCPPGSRVVDMRDSVTEVTGKTGLDLGAASVCLLGATVRGTFDRDLDWEIVKSLQLADDGIRWDRYDPGEVWIIGSITDNLADDIAPPKSPETNRGLSWHLDHVYGRYSRDDFIENDSCLDGSVSNTLVENAWTFISARPGTGNEAFMSQFSATHEVTNSLVRLRCQPDSRAGKDDGHSCGQSDQSSPNDDSQGASARIMKASGCSGEVNMSDTLIVIDALSNRGGTPMAFPPGVYQIVYLIIHVMGVKPSSFRRTASA